jgi:hypothetical protein
MELITFTASGSWNEAGVNVGPHTFRSFPLPGEDAGRRFSMVAYAWDLPRNLTPMVYARNQVGTEATGRFWFKLFPKKFRERDFVLDDALIEKLVNNIDPGGTLAPGPDLLSRFLKINGEMRRKNNQQLADLRTKTEAKVLWNPETATCRPGPAHGRADRSRLHTARSGSRRASASPARAHW